VDPHSCSPRRTFLIIMRSAAAMLAFALLLASGAANAQAGATPRAAACKRTRKRMRIKRPQRIGRGRVAEWVARHGDPRDPNVDAVDWIERIPFAETRNYVQRVMENLQVYCVRSGTSTATLEPNLHRAAPVGSRANPILVQAIP
jgi:hypothetical protein